MLQALVTPADTYSGVRITGQGLERMHDLQVMLCNSVCEQKSAPGDNR